MVHESIIISHIMPQNRTSINLLSISVRGFPIRSHLHIILLNVSVQENHPKYITKLFIEK